MIRLNQDTGFDILANDNPITISRFPLRIKLLHWFNALMIISLYVLALIQITTIYGDLTPNSIDYRSIHVLIGKIWAVGLVVFIFARIVTRKKEKVFLTGKLIIKQRVFLWVTVSTIIFMATTGLTLHFTQYKNIPEAHTILLALHGLVAGLFLLVIIFHICIALFKKDSHKALRTIFTDVKIKHLVHSNIPSLTCSLSDNDTIFSLNYKVAHISIVDFQVDIPEGNWQSYFDLNTLNFVEFYHKELVTPLKMKISSVEHYSQNGFVHALFSFSPDIQSNAQSLMSKAVFFQYLYLQKRIYPRLTCHLPTMIYTEEGEYLGEMVNLSINGGGLLLPVKLPVNTRLRLVVVLRHPVYHLDIEGKIVIRNRINNYDWSYGINFNHDQENQIAQISKILDWLSLTKQNSV